MIITSKIRSSGDSLVVCFRRLLLFVAVLVVARLTNYSSGLVFADDPMTGRSIRPALHARRPRGRGEVQLVLRVASQAKFSPGLIFAREPLIGLIRPALHARRPAAVSMASSCEEYGTRTT